MDEEGKAVTYLRGNKGLDVTYREGKITGVRVSPDKGVELRIGQGSGAKWHSRDGVIKQIESGRVKYDNMKSLHSKTRYKASEAGFSDHPMSSMRKLGNEVNKHVDGLLKRLDEEGKAVTYLRGRKELAVPYEGKITGIRVSPDKGTEFRMGQGKGAKWYSRDDIANQVKANRAKYDNIKSLHSKTRDKVSGTRIVDPGHPELKEFAAKINQHADDLLKRLDEEGKAAINLTGSKGIRPANKKNQGKVFTGVRVSPDKGVEVSTGRGRGKKWYSSDYINSQFKKELKDVRAREIKLIQKESLDRIPSSRLPKLEDPKMDKLAREVNKRIDQVAKKMGDNGKGAVYFRQGSELDTPIGNITGVRLDPAKGVEFRTGRSRGGKWHSGEDLANKIKKQSKENAKLNNIKALKQKTTSRVKESKLPKFSDKEMNKFGSDINKNIDQGLRHLDENGKAEAYFKGGDGPRSLIGQVVGMKLDPVKGIQLQMKQGTRVRWYSRDEVVDQIDSFIRINQRAQ